MKKSNTTTKTTTTANTAPAIVQNAAEIVTIFKKDGTNYTVMAYKYDSAAENAAAVAHFAALRAVLLVLRPLRSNNTHYAAAYVDICRCLSVFAAYDKQGINTAAEMCEAVKNSAPTDANAIDLYGAAVCAIIDPINNTAEKQRARAIKAVNAELWALRRSTYEQLTAAEIAAAENTAEIVAAYIAAENTADSAENTAEIVAAIYDIVAETKRGAEIIQALKSGASRRAIARHMGISDTAVRKVLAYIRRRLSEAGLIV